VPVFGRLAASFGGWFGRPARPEGLGASITGSATVGSVAPAVLCVALTGAVLAWMNPVAGTAVVVVGVVGAAIVPHLLSRRFGGVTGDVLGASVLLVETLTAVVAAWLW
jgi:adenosylcobinamide-GDP ribazoletransferase